MSITIPGGMCEAHRASAIKWKNHMYKPHHPSEWPGGSIIMDARTSHAEREQDWIKKNNEQIGLIIGICSRRVSCSDDAA